MNTVHDIAMASPGAAGPWPEQALAGFAGGLAHAFHGFIGAVTMRDGAQWRSALSRHLGERLPPERIHLLPQRHSAHIVDLPGTAGDGELCPAADGGVLWGEQPGAVVVRSADCVPVLAVHPGLGACAGLHAGWRGAAAGILPRLLARWAEAGGAPEAVHLAFGAAIGPCCYEVGPECLERFAPEHLEEAVHYNGGRPRLDLVAVLCNQALQHGVPAHRLHGVGACTRCARVPGGLPVYASHRRALRAGVPRRTTNLSYIGLGPSPG